MRRFFLASVAVLLGSSAALAQQAPLAFEVASIRPNGSGDPASGGVGSYMGIQGDRFIATNQTLERLIRAAYSPRLDSRQIREDLLIGGPDWIRRSRFDVNATAGRDASDDQLYLMLETLLEERFGLVVGKGQLERDVYVLSAAREDGRLGPNIRRVDECRDSLAFLRDADGDGKPDGPVPDKIEFHSFEPPEPLPRGNKTGGCGTMSGLARSLSRMLETTVVDNTGLEGDWDYVFAYAGVAPRPGDGPEAPVIFTAVEEQLGLRLERERGNVDVLVVDEVHDLIEN